MRNNGYAGHFPKQLRPKMPEQSSITVREVEIHLTLTDDEARALGTALKIFTNPMAMGDISSEQAVLRSFANFLQDAQRNQLEGTLIVDYITDTVINSYSS